MFLCLSNSNILKVDCTFRRGSVCSLVLPRVHAVPGCPSASGLGMFGKILVPCRRSPCADLQQTCAYVKGASKSTTSATPSTCELLILRSCHVRALFLAAWNRREGGHKEVRKVGQRRKRTKEPAGLGLFGACYSDAHFKRNTTQFPSARSHHRHPTNRSRGFEARMDLGVVYHIETPQQFWAGRSIPF